jgi:hypothetical protein
MPYAVRNKNGQVIVLLREATNDNTEFLNSDHKDVIAFMDEEKHGAEQALAESDKDLSRVIEDLVQLLVDKNNIMFTELPPAVQFKLLNREKLRNSLKTTNNSFLQDDDILI